MFTNNALKIHHFLFWKRYGSPQGDGSIPVDSACSIKDSPVCYRYKSLAPCESLKKINKYWVYFKYFGSAGDSKLWKFSAQQCTSFNSLATCC